MRFVGDFRLESIGAFGGLVGFIRTEAVVAFAGLALEEVDDAVCGKELVSSFCGAVRLESVGAFGGMTLLGFICTESVVPFGGGAALVAAFFGKEATDAQIKENVNKLFLMCEQLNSKASFSFRKRK